MTVVETKTGPGTSRTPGYERGKRLLARLENGRLGGEPPKNEEPEGASSGSLRLLAGSGASAQLAEGGGQHDFLHGEVPGYFGFSRGLREFVP